MLNVDAIASAEAAREPFSYFLAQVLGKHDLDNVRSDFPAIGKPGFPLEELQYGPAFGALVQELQSPAVAEAVGKQLGIELKALPTMITVRGRAQALARPAQAAGKGKAPHPLLLQRKVA